LITLFNAEARDEGRIEALKQTVYTDAQAPEELRSIVMELIATLINETTALAKGPKLEMSQKVRTRSIAAWLT